METKRVKHTGRDFYKVYSCVKGSKIDRWFYYKSYASKQSSLNAIKRIKEKEKYIPLKFMIEWSPYPYCNRENCIIVYEEA